MASFILRHIDPDLWAKVQARALVEGLTVKALILKALAQYVAVVALLLIATGCVSHNPLAATPVVATTVPAVPIVTSDPPAPLPGKVSVSVHVQTSSPERGTPIFFAYTIDKDATAPAVRTVTILFGDGDAPTTLDPSKASNASAVVQHTYGRSGKFAVTVTVTDASGGTTIGTTTAVVNDPPPPAPPAPTPPPPAPTYTVTVTVSPGLFAGDAATLTGTVMPQNGAPATIRTYSWNFGDGSPATTSPGPSTTHIYAAGSWTAVLTATSGTASGSGSVAITVSPLVIPVVTITCNTVTAPTSTRCAASATLNGTAVPSTQVTSVDWDWGDSTTSLAAPGNTAMHPYGVPLIYHVVGTATVTAHGSLGAGTGAGTAEVK